MEPDQRLPEPVEVESVPLPQRADAYLAAHRELLERLGLGGA